MSSANESEVEVEVADFEPLAHAATLGLIYYRALGDVARATWDKKIQDTINDARKQMKVVLQTGQTTWRQAA